MAFRFVIQGSRCRWNGRSRKFLKFSLLLSGVLLLNHIVSRHLKNNEGRTSVIGSSNDHKIEIPNLLLQHPGDAMSKGVKEARSSHAIHDNTEQISIQQGKKANLRTDKTNPKRKTDSSIVCGGHTASSCADCPQGHGASWCNGQCAWVSGRCTDRPSHVHPDYYTLLKEYPFQPVATEKGEHVNVILVRAPLNQRRKKLYHKYKHEILFLGISSFETFPLSSPNPFSANFSNEEYRGLFPGFLTMMPNPDAYFDPHVKTILMSQSDFNLQGPMKFGRKQSTAVKKYDFTFSGTDQDVHRNCVGWSSFAKNWTFVLEALEVMCSDEFGLTGVLVATKDKQGMRACSIPESCNGKMLQTSFLDQNDFFNYLVQSKFAFVPQVYDASPRVTTQALSMNVPMLMNDNIVGGWKYLNQQTGEFFHDMSDFRQSLRRLLNSLDTYTPLEYVKANYGNQNAGVKLKDFVMKHWGDRVKLPEGTRLLIPSGA